MTALEQLRADFAAFVTAASNLEASLDQCGTSRVVASDMDNAQTLLGFKHIRERCEALISVSNRNRDLVVRHLAKALISKDTDVISSDTHNFTVGAKSYVHAPSRSKKPKEFAEFVKYMQEKLGHQSVIETSEVTIDGKQLQEICNVLNEAGQPLPPHVSEHSDLDIKITSKRKKP